MKWIGLGFLSLVVLSAASCGTRGSADPSVVRAASSLVSSVSADKWKDLGRRRIYFAHMSVGFNIIQGIQDLESNSPTVALRIVESRKPEALETPGFAHYLNGENGDPLGKITIFRETLDRGVGKVADIAMLKFCYVDFDGDTDVAQVFDEYKKAM